MNNKEEQREKIIHKTTLTYEITISLDKRRIVLENILYWDF